MSFVIKGYKVMPSDGVFYSGRSGRAFVCDRAEEAFRYQTRQAAMAQARGLNSMTDHHGWTFVVEEDA